MLGLKLNDISKSGPLSEPNELGNLWLVAQRSGIVHTRAYIIPWSRREYLNIFLQSLDIILPWVAVGPDGYFRRFMQSFVRPSVCTSRRKTLLILFFNDFRYRPKIDGAMHSIMDLWLSADEYKAPAKISGI